MMNENEIERRALRAQELFRSGYNCSQAVFASCADMLGVADEQLALRLSASFGGGIGRMRLTCGAACGMFLLEGLHSGSATAGDHEAKGANYARVQQLAEAFSQEHGALECAVLTGLKPDGPAPAERDAAYFQKRPCVEIVGNAVRIFLRSLDEKA